MGRHTILHQVALLMEPEYTMCARQTLCSDSQTNSMKTTHYFRTSVMARRPYLRAEWVQCVLRNPIDTQVQANGRIRRWAFIQEVGKYLRVVTEPDGETVHNAFFDRRFRP
jgi:hypothetical protein